MIALYLGISAEGRLQDVGEFGVPERNVKSITLQRTEHLKGREKKQHRPLNWKKFLSFDWMVHACAWWELYLKHGPPGRHPTRRTLSSFRTCPSAVRDLLMAAASTSRWPSASVFEIRSEPARSHKVSVPRVVSPDTGSEPSTSSATTR